MAVAVSGPSAHVTPQRRRRKLMTAFRATAAMFVCAVTMGAAVLVSAADQQCDANGEGEGCASIVESAPLEVPPPPAPSTSEVPSNGSNTSEPEVHIHKPLGKIEIGILLSLFGSVCLWIAATIKFACDGSLPARLALWGLLPEAYACVSVSAAVALLRLKTNETPVLVLRNCVSDAGAQELAAAMRTYGKKADLQALELPHNPRLSEEGLRSLVAAAAEEGSTLQELDVSYNPQFRGVCCAVVRPIIKKSRVTTLRLADCGLTKASLQQLATDIDKSKVRMLDLSWNNLAGAGAVLAELCEAPMLEELMLTRCGLTTEDVIELADQLPFTSIKSFQLGGNKFAQEGLMALTEKLPESQVDELGLEGNDLGPECLDPIGSAWAKRPFSRIRLHGNRLSQEEYSQFIRTLKSLNI